MAFRPPWALPETDFISRCTRCGACLDICPTKLIIKGRGGFPEVDFSRSECIFCGDCVKSCRDNALAVEQNHSPWAIKAVISESCFARRQVVCRTCGEQCEAGAIRFQFRTGAVAEPLVNAAACTGCGACVRVCPGNAVSMALTVDNEALAA